MRSILLVITVLSLSIAACNNETTSNTTETPAKTDSLPPVQSIVFDILIGTWQSTSGNNFEQWTKNDNETYRCIGYSVKGTDTSWNEQASIYPEKGKWVFENTVKGQNNGQAVKFISSSINENSVQFSNPAHDFPTDINYTVPDANTINAFIVGPNNKGGKDTIPFNFTRVK